MEPRLDFQSSQILQKFVKHVNAAARPRRTRPCPPGPPTWS